VCKPKTSVSWVRVAAIAAPVVVVIVWGALIYSVLSTVIGLAALAFIIGRISFLLYVIISETDFLDNVLARRKENKMIAARREAMIEELRQPIVLDYTPIVRDEVLVKNLEKELDF
jgi:hypothetical protein